MNLQEVDINDYDYPLTDERIAKYPAEPRNHSRLLVCKSGKIESKHFFDLTDVLPADAHLVFNNTRVIPARLFFRKTTGAVIEIFLLNPVSHHGIISQAMEATGSTVWHCIVGNKKKWKEEEIQSIVDISGKQISVRAKWSDRDQNHVEICWSESAVPFAELVKAFGQMPLPPYLNRETEKSDEDTYQTVYARNDGAVAAPTAGLHFTPDTFEQLGARGITQTEITLHVGAGTFQPVKVQNALDHPMHNEQIVFSLQQIEDLLENLKKKVIPVGTTSMRSLESLYWYGVKLIKEGEQSSFWIEKLYSYQFGDEELPTAEESLAEVKRHIERINQKLLTGHTEIFILPGYTFRICKGIITNFHQPKSTLLLLISALMGEKWKEIYEFALSRDYRFLSYGDSSLLLP
jgi:S-adenosylmethionine:tRNA ribosyltransferase-isomerase